MIRYIKRQEIKKMLAFLGYKKDEHHIMNNFAVENKGFVTVSGEGEFFSNVYMSRRSVWDPSLTLIEHTHDSLTKASMVKLKGLRVKCGVPNLQWLLIKYHKLGIDQNG
jgi:hypothetical protein